MPYLELDIDSYEDCFKQVPGVEVVYAEYFGSYQGEFLCKIKKDGQELYISDGYGSCSGCDAFQAEFGWGTYYDDSGDGPSLEERLEHERERARKFAFSYIESALPKEQMIALLKKEIEEGAWGDTQAALDKILGEL